MSADVDVGVDMECRSLLTESDKPPQEPAGREVVFNEEKKTSSTLSFFSHLTIPWEANISELAPAGVNNNMKSLKHGWE